MIRGRGRVLRAPTLRNAGIISTKRVPGAFRNTTTGAVVAKRGVAQPGSAYGWGP